MMRSNLKEAGKTRLMRLKIKIKAVVK